MKKLIFILITLNSILFGVGEAGAIFLLISPSPTMNGFAGAGTSISTTDIYSSYYNPAQPQLPNGLSIQFSDTKTDWLPNLASDLKYNYDVQMVGYSGFSLFDRHQLQFSITTSKTYLDLGERIGMDEFGNPTDNWNSYLSADAITYSLGIKSNNFPIYFGIGRTNKEATQVLSDQVIAGEEGIGTSIDEFYDWGFRFSIDNYKPRKLQNIGLSYSFGYSKSNIGDPISFVDVDQTDPPPITSRLGMTFGGNLIIYNNLGIDFKFVREAEELMVDRIANENIAIGYEDIYKDGYLGDIDIQKHLLNGKGDEDVIIHKGSEITLFNFYSIRKGKHIDLDGKVEYKTRGYGIDFGEMIKSTSYIFESPSIREMKLLNYVNLKYNSSKYSAEIGHPLDNISFDELTISIKNIDNIFYNDTKGIEEELIMNENLQSSNNNISLIGGINLSKWAGDDMDNLNLGEDEIENQQGFKLGIEKLLDNNLISGMTFSQRGFKVESGTSELEMQLNYLTGYLLKPQSVSTNLDLLLGFEVGYFLNGKMKMKMCIESDCTSESENIDSDDWKDEMDGNMIDYGIVIGGKIPLNEKLSINGTYYYGINDISSELLVKNRSYQIYLSIPL